jgi:hypothetical protein
MTVIKVDQNGLNHPFASTGRPGSWQGCPYHGMSDPQISQIGTDIKRVGFTTRSEYLAGSTAVTEEGLE